MTERVLSRDDRFYLVANLKLESPGAPGDRQAQRVYAVESNVIDIYSPIWTSREVEQWITRAAREFCVPIKLAWQSANGDCLAFEDANGWVIELPSDRSHPQFRPLKHGQFLASTVVHECAHVISSSVSSPDELESHGPEFVQTYVALLERVMEVGLARAAYKFMGVKLGGGLASHSTRDGSSPSAGAQNGGPIR